MRLFLSKGGKEEATEKKVNLPGIVHFLSVSSHGVPRLSTREEKGRDRAELMIQRHHYKAKDNSQLTLAGYRDPG